MKMSLFCLIFFSAFKDDAGTLAASEYWSDISWDPLVLILKKASVFVGLLGVISAVLGVAQQSKQRLRKESLAIIYLSLIGYAVIRGFVFSEKIGFKLFVGFIYVLIYAFWIEVYICQNGLRKYLNVLFDVFKYFAAFFAAVNFFSLINGYGFVPGNPRFFGSSTHPNFIGVNLAVMNLFLIIGAIKSYPRMVSTTFWIVLLGLGLIGQVASGSRTGLLVFAVGLMAYFLAHAKFRIRAPFAGALLIMVMAIISMNYLFVSDSYEAFSRGENGFDTRSAVWSALLVDVMTNPLFGAGYFTGPSENSFLRAAAAFGVAHSVGLLFVLVASMRYLASGSIREKVDGVFPAFFGVLIGLGVGSMLEGYLVDAISLPVILFFLIVSICTSSLKRFS